MRRFVLILVAVLCGPVGVEAQTATEGPLAAPSSGTPPHPSKKAIARKHKHAAGSAGSPIGGAADGNAQPAEAHARGRQGVASPAADPLSFGMQWNGSNDSARATRVQNYDGDAAGTGASVGMKLHF